MKAHQLKPRRQRGPKKPIRQKANNLWWARVHVPKDIRHLYTSPDIWKNLGHDYDLACRMLPSVVASIFDEFDHKRLHQPRHLSEIDIADAEARKAFLQRRREEMAVRGDEILREVLAARPTLERLTPEQLEKEIKAAKRMLAATEAAVGIKPDIELHEAVQAGTYALSTYAVSQVRRAIPHVLIDDDVKRYLPEAGLTLHHGLTLAELVEQFQNDHRRNDSVKTETWGNYRRAVEVMLNVLGTGTLARTVKRPNMERVARTVKYLVRNAESHAEYNGSLEKLSAKIEAQIKDAEERGAPYPVKLLLPATVNKYIRSLQSLFRWAKENQHIDTNPAESLTFNFGDHETSKRRRFRDDEIRRLFPKGYRLTGINWIPVVALLQGMRPTEICQLHVNDIVTSDGVTCIRVEVEETEDPRLRQKSDKTLKTAHSQRDLPVHQRLIDLGFLIYVEERRRQEHKHLYDITPHRNGSRYEPVRDEFKKWIEDAGVYIQGETTFYSLRHSFAEAVAAAMDAGKISGQQFNALAGWSDKRSNGLAQAMDGVNPVSRNYVKEGLSPARLKEALDSIDFPILEAEDRAPAPAASSEAADTA